MRKPTKAQIAMLQNAYFGKPLRDGIKGQSAHGGATGTWFALRQRKWLDENNKITLEGKKALGVEKDQST